MKADDYARVRVVPRASMVVLTLVCWQTFITATAEIPSLVIAVLLIDSVGRRMTLVYSFAGNTCTRENPLDVLCR